jgi:hypothetical protein
MSIRGRGHWLARPQQQQNQYEYQVGYNTKISSRGRVVRKGFFNSNFKLDTTQRYSVKKEN